MSVYEIVVPGGFVVIEEGDDASWKLQLWLSALVDAFHEANYCAIHYHSLITSGTSTQTTEAEDLAKHWSRINEMSEIEEEIQRAGDDIEPAILQLSQSRSVARNVQARTIWSRRKIEREGAADIFRDKAIGVACKSYIYALDGCYKIVKRVSEVYPKYYSDYPVRFDDKLPDLVQLRDTFHHSEDRSVAEVFKKPISLKPINERWISEGALANIRFSLDGNVVGATLGNGKFGKVSISHDVLLCVRDIIQSALLEVEWTGNPKVPRVKPYS